MAFFLIAGARGIALGARGIRGARGTVVRGIRAIFGALNVALGALIPTALGILILKLGCRVLRRGALGTLTLRLATRALRMPVLRVPLVVRVLPDEEVELLLLPLPSVTVPYLFLNLFFDSIPAFTSASP
jgi:hypothetical protein